MIESLLEFGDTLAREIMVPRTEIHTIAVDAPVAEILEKARQFGHSRFPVYEEGLDHILGILHVKDLLGSWGSEAVDLRKLLRPVPFVPETKKITDLLAELRGARSHMAVVIDEYGGTSGILTIEDIIEEIVGEIQDEHDDEEPLLVELRGDEILVDARLDVDELAHRFNIQIPKQGFETVGGFITAQAGQVPQPGDKITFDGLEFIVEEADERRIRKVKVHRAPAA